MERAKAIIAKAGGKVLSIPKSVYVREAVELMKYPNTVKLRIQVIRI